MDLEEALRRVGTTYFPGSSVDNKTYQDLRDLGVDHPFHRPNTAKRVDTISHHLLGKTNMRRGIDIGCSVGGITTGLAAYGFDMVGVDCDFQSIMVAQAVSDRLGASAKFHVMDVCSRNFYRLLETGNFDFALHLSVFMWIAKEKGMDVAVDHLKRVAQHVERVVFETAQHPEDGVAGDFYLSPTQIDALLTDCGLISTSFNQDDGWANRTIFWAWKG